ncbi:hypothetical protein SAMN05421788_1011147 [Filimonas lacunae]|uniref:Uncharacterized protein n=2 Tax=Filimonas lacunae TaxID=477680 RepID=A0A173MPY8_9BACT|nr:hypothetical protein FLA_5765 [Filimonas lacunae]SIS77685.1 hypothetical protein SAMN05421788_1011147 [Filimonas lacunae]
MALMVTTTLVTVSAKDFNTQQQDIKKGYFAIGNNAQKLPVATTVAAEQDSTAVAAQKGFYTIGDNDKKLASPRLKVKNITNSKRPVIQKGYYSIGNNADKLR